MHKRKTSVQISAIHGLSEAEFGDFLRSHLPDDVFDHILRCHECLEHARTLAKKDESSLPTLDRTVLERLFSS